VFPDNKPVFLGNKHVLLGDKQLFFNDKGTYGPVKQAFVMGKRYRDLPAIRHLTTNHANKYEERR
jgi:hypothetical protein